MSSLVVMSKGTKYTQQSYKVSDSFPYEWIKKKWREAFHVTAMATSSTQVCTVWAGCAGGGGLGAWREWGRCGAVRMAACTAWLCLGASPRSLPLPHTAPDSATNHTAPHHTAPHFTAPRCPALPCPAPQWAVVMSRGAGYLDQVVELDFQYPSEGIHKRWDGGYRITAMASTPDQVRCGAVR